MVFECDTIVTVRRGPCYRPQTEQVSTRAGLSDRAGQDVLGSVLLRGSGSVSMVTVYLRTGADWITESELLELLSGMGACLL